MASQMLMVHPCPPCKSLPISLTAHGQGIPPPLLAKSWAQSHSWGKQAGQGVTKAVGMSMLVIRLYHLHRLHAGNNTTLYWPHLQRSLPTPTILCFSDFCLPLKRLTYFLHLPLRPFLHMKYWLDDCLLQAYNGYFYWKMEAPTASLL